MKFFLNFFFHPRLSADFTKKMRIADNFWSSLPEKICNDVSVTDRGTDCWNGIGKGRLVLLDGISFRTKYSGVTLTYFFCCNHVEV